MNASLPTSPLAGLIVAAVVATPAVVAQPPDHRMDHSAHHSHPRQHGHVAEGRPAPREGGNAIFAALAEIVTVLDADPATDWSQVDVGALRDHLLDMSTLFERAEVDSEAIPGGARFRVSGDEEVLAAAGRMVPAHARASSGPDGPRLAARVEADAVVLEATAADDAGAARIRALGFFGLMAAGEHHRPHHLAIALGSAPH